MLRGTLAKAKPRRSPTKYRGIVRVSTELGFSREHIWLVLENKRRNAPLRKRAIQLLKEAA